MSELEKRLQESTEAMKELTAVLAKHVETATQMIEITAHLLQALAEQEEADEVIDDGADTYLNGQPKL